MDDHDNVAGKNLNIRTAIDENIERIVELDAEAGGMRREDFFRKRWQAMHSDLDAYIAFAAFYGESVTGFAIAHILSGEFGTDDRYAIVDGFAVDASHRRSGIGGELIEALKDEARLRGCTDVRTQVEWQRQDLLTFLAGLDFTPAPVIALERELG
ncbi:MAG: hypothetical protein DHS20C01_14710 [marine bacterium B5-7]|nr:MAG: hypothetical protein DHS20C01_14710 [marine bacterium B5-7]